MVNNKLIDSLFFWLFGLFCLIFLNLFYEPEKIIWISLILVYLYPLFFCLIIFSVTRYVKQIKIKLILSYLLYFSITITSVFGYTKVMDGSYASSPNLILFGLSFYTTTIGYILFKKKYLNIADVLFASNPILIFTGPILVYFKNIKHKKIKSRIKYFFPYFIIGVFLIESVSNYITPTFYLSKNLDLVSSLGFAVIFELYIYANFCGLSLILYSISGIYGYLIPLNFKQPFSSNNVIEFWRGWHISLSFVLKEFFYKPIRNKTNVYFSILIVFLASALWHGVSLTFIMWGLIHFLCFSLTIFLSKKRIKIFNKLILIFAIIIGRLFFLESDLSTLFNKLYFKFDGFDFFDELMNQSMLTIFAILTMLFVVFLEFNFKKHKYFRNRNYKFLRLSFVQLILLILIILSASDSIGKFYPVYGQR